jgi:hypothetical protein
VAIPNPAVKIQDIWFLPQFIIAAPIRKSQELEPFAPYSKFGYIIKVNCSVGAVRCCGSRRSLAPAALFG